MNVYVSESRMEYYSMKGLLYSDVVIYIISIYLTWKWVPVTHYHFEDPQTQS